MQYSATAKILGASIAAFVGSLLADVVLGDGIQLEDIHQAVMVAAIVAAVQWIMLARR